MIKDEEETILGVLEIIGACYGHRFEALAPAGLGMVVTLVGKCRGGSVEHRHCRHILRLSVSCLDFPSFGTIEDPIHRLRGRKRRAIALQSEVEQVHIFC